jgi:hypothetical protein
LAGIPRLDQIPLTADTALIVPAGPTPNSTGPSAVSARVSDAGLSAGPSGTGVLVVQVPDCSLDSASWPAAST